MNPGGNKDLDRIYRMKQDKNIEKSTTHHPVNPVNPVKKLILIKVTVTKNLSEETKWHF